MTQGRTIDLWMAAEPRDLPSALSARWFDLLSDEERGRWQRFARDEDRLRFLLTRALVRRVLARQLDLSPSSLQFAAGPFGKPRLQWPDESPLHFNLSHTRGFSVLALAQEVELGVDVESVGRRVDLLPLAQRYFAACEAAAIEALAEEPQRELFFALWTLKEAWVKAKGLGLRLPLDAFSFHGPGLLPAGNHAPATAAPGAPDNTGIVVRCDPQLLEVPEHWSFRLLQQGEFRIALALAQPATQPLEIRLHDALPLLLDPQG